MFLSAEELLEQLDEQQQAVARSFHRPIAVLAGAGSGKTRALTYRIAYGVLTGKYQENRVMALTFTTQAADELRIRLQGLGILGGGARTFHSAALAQLRYFWPLAVGGRSPSILDGKGKLLAEIAAQLNIRVDAAVLRDIAAEIEWRKVNQLSIEQYAEHQRELPPGFSQERFAEFQELYEQIKLDRHQLDFEDVLLATAGMIEAEPVVAEQVRQQYRSFLVDEYQDVSPLQQRLLDLWLGGRDDLMVVGDVAQTIYSFAGASAEFLRRFESRYPLAEVIRLETNYRSTPNIVYEANALMHNEPWALTLVSHQQEKDAEPNPSVRLEVFSTDTDEANQVAVQIDELIRSGVAANKIAILYRMNIQAALLEGALNARNIRYQIHGGTRFFDLREVRQAILLLNGAAKSMGSEPVENAVDDVLSTLGWQPEAPKYPGANRDAWDSLNLLREMIDPARHRTLSEFVKELLQRQQTQHAPERDAVTLATIHSAKGMEWDAVFIIGLSEGLIPSYFAVSDGQIAEEKRLLYVGMTRAKRYLQLSYAKEDHYGQFRQPSRFLKNLPASKNSPDAVATSDTASNRPG